MLRLRIFVSSPGDVGAERAVALAVVERLQLEFRGQVRLEAYLWERSLLRATDTFQAQIIDIQETDLALFILWARVGTPLSLDQFSRPDGSQYSSGTEYEFERARDGYDKRKSPEIFCYLKTAEVGLSMKDRELRTQQVAELDKVSQFADTWFRNLDGTFKSAFYNFEKTAQFEELIEVHLRDWVRDRLRSSEAASAARPVWKGSPFRGLQAFDFEHALIYCGRTGLVSEALDALRLRGAAGQGFMVTGMSGVGKLVAPAQHAKVAEAIQKATDWLDRSALRGTARWTEYPSSATFEKGEYLAASALVIHVLRTVAASNRFDALWLDRLPQSVPDPLQSEISKGVVFRSKTQITLDEVRHYLFPWMLRTTVESYAKGNASHRARAVLWIEEAFKRPLHAEDFHSEYWTIAETVFALRHVEAQLNANSAQNSRNRLSTFIRNRTRVAASM